MLTACARTKRLWPLHGLELWQSSWDTSLEGSCWTWKNLWASKIQLVGGRLLSWLEARGWTWCPEIAVDKSSNAYLCGCPSFVPCSFIPCFQKHDGSMFEIRLISPRYSLLRLPSSLCYLVSKSYVPRTGTELGYWEGQGTQAAGLSGLTF